MAQHPTEPKIPELPEPQPQPQPQPHRVTEENRDAKSDLRVKVAARQDKTVKKR